MTEEARYRAIDALCAVLSQQPYRWESWHGPDLILLRALSESLARAADASQC